MSDIVSDTDHVPKGRLRRIAEEEHILVVLLAGFGLIFLLIFPPALLVNDSWLNLMAGREVIENGLPTVDELTLYGLGSTWTDQQWGAQVFMYGVYSLGGFALLSIMACVFVVGAFTLAAAASRALGAGPRAIWLLFLPVLISAALGWSIRAQMLTLPLYTGLLWLLATQARRPTNLVWISLPMLVVWGNLHGSAALGAMLVMLLGAYELVRTRGRTWLRSAGLVVLAPLADPRHPVRARDDRALLPPAARRSAVRGSGDGVALARTRHEYGRLLRPPCFGCPDRHLGSPPPDRVRHRRPRAHARRRVSPPYAGSPGSRSRAWSSSRSRSARAREPQARRAEARPERRDQHRTRGGERPGGGRALLEERRLLRGLLAQRTRSTPFAQSSGRATASSSRTDSRTGCSGRSPSFGDASPTTSASRSTTGSSSAASPTTTGSRVTGSRSQTATGSSSSTRRTVRTPPTSSRSRERA